MLCDFTAGVEVSTFLNLHARAGRGRPRTPQNAPPLPPGPGNLETTQYRVIEAGHWHNRFPGETRAHVDLTRLVSFYDTTLFPSLAEARFRQERWDHRVQRLGEEGRRVLMSRLDQVLGPENQGGSSVDWSSIIRVIIHRHADRIEALQYLLNKAQPDLKETFEYISSMLTPYTLNAVRPPLTPSSASPLSWAAPNFELCATAHTRFVRRSLLAKLTQSERLIHESIEGVSREICRVLVGIWAEGVELGLDSPLPSTSRDASAVAASWSGKIDNLMKWLDWSVWVQCRPTCSFEVGDPTHSIVP